MDDIQHVIEQVVANTHPVKATSPTNSGAPSSVLARFDAYCPALVLAKAKTIEFMERKLTGLVLAGDTGSGKTHLARGASHYMRSAYTLNFVVEFISEPAMLEAIRAGYDGSSSEQKTIMRLRRADALIIDDVGAGYVRADSIDWLRSIYWEILDGRLERERPVLFTTNLRMPQLLTRLGKRATSRLVGLLQYDYNYVEMFGSGKGAVIDYRANDWKGVKR